MVPRTTRSGTPASRIVAVLVDTSTGWGRSIVQGIHQYARAHGPWLLDIEARGIEERQRLPRGWRGDGIIARISDPAMLRHVTATGVPVVNVSGIRFPGSDAVPRVTTDLEASVRIAAQHFAERGLRNFAYCGTHKLSYVVEHREAFRRLASEMGCTFDAFQPRTDDHSGLASQLAELRRWLERLPKPVGVLCWSSRRGRHVIYACRTAGILIPDEVAVLSGDNDDLLCEVTQPALSGIRVASERIGFEAASLLDRLMRGESPPPCAIRIEPIGVVARASTDILAIADKQIAAAVRFIREHAAEPIRVSDVLRHVPMSRRSLERRFLDLLGRTPADEIRRVHLERARALLTGSDLPIPDVAARSGFGSPEYMSYVFKHELGVTPLKYRKTMRAR